MFPGSGLGKNHSPGVPLWDPVGRPQRMLDIENNNSVLVPSSDAFVPSSVLAPRSKEESREPIRPSSMSQICQMVLQLNLINTYYEY